MNLLAIFGKITCVGLMTLCSLTSATAGIFAYKPCSSSMNAGNHISAITKMEILQTAPKISNTTWGKSICCLIFLDGQDSESNYGATFTALVFYNGVCKAKCTASVTGESRNVNWVCMPPRYKNCTPSYDGSLNLVSRCGFQ